jgi:large subunit ribosomal protein L35
MKLKTSKTAVKRLRRTGSGQLQQPTPSHQHLRHNKSTRQLKQAKRYSLTTKGNQRRLAKLVPYL